MQHSSGHLKVSLLPHIQSSYNVVLADSTTFSLQKSTKKFYMHTHVNRDVEGDYGTQSSSGMEWGILNVLTNGTSLPIDTKEWYGDEATSLLY